MNEKLSQLISSILADNNLPDVQPSLREIPFEGQLGLALSNVFQIAREAYPDSDKKELKNKANEIADLIAAKLNETGEFEKVESVKGYVNCFFNPGAFGRDLLKKIFDGGTAWAEGEPVSGKAMVEYSQPNTHKAFHIGHVRNAVTGMSLVRCFRYAGRETLSANYYGDIGSHVFKSLWYLTEFKPDMSVEPADRGKWLGDIYRKADGLLVESNDLKNEVWDALKPLLVDIEDHWRDSSLIQKLSIDKFLVPIALKEEDLFENRPNDEIGEIIGKLYKACLAICSSVDTPKASGHLDDLKKILCRDDFEIVWNRSRDILSIADKWNSGDKSLSDLWNTTRQWSLDDFHRIYAEIGAEFDIEFFESEVESEGLKIVGELEAKNIVVDSNGAKIVEIDTQLHEKFGEKLKDKYRVMVLVRKDGASLYGSKDLALAKKKFEEYDIDESIYVVGNEQKFYFQQLFQVLRLLGFPQWEKCFHLSYELVMLPGGKISSRKGQVVFYDDVMIELRERALKVVREKNPGLEEESKASVADSVARGALIYGMLRVDTNKKIEFDFDEVLDFNGRSAPYIQYAATRANSIFRKAAAENIEVPDSVSDSDFSGEIKPIEIELLKLLSRFPDIVGKVVKDKKPFHLATYLYDIAVAFSDFYHQCPVLPAEPDIRRHRMLLVRAVRINLEAGLELLGIDTPDVM